MTGYSRQGPGRAEAEPDVPPGTDYWSRIRRRQRHELGIPWQLGDKTLAQRYFEASGFPHPRVLQQFNTVGTIKFGSLPASFVLKPTFAHTSSGVFLIERRSGGFYDAFRGGRVTLAQIRTELKALYEQFDRDPSSVNFVAEEVVQDAEELPVPIDYKFLMFYDRVGMCWAVDRNVSPPRHDYWSPDLQPLARGAVHHLQPGELARGERAAPDALWALRDLAVNVSTSLPIPMCRVDLYMSRDGPVLGEVTLLPGNFYYEDRSILSAGESARMGALWGQAEQKVLEAFGRYPLYSGDVNLDSLLDINSARRSRPGLR